MIYRGLGFLAVLRFGYSPPLPSASCFSFSDFPCFAGRAYTDGRGGGGRWGGAKSYNGGNVNHSIISSSICPEAGCRAVCGPSHITVFLFCGVHNHIFLFFRGILFETLKVHKNDNFFGFDFEFCTISLLVMSKY
jgi:hypothetical protein